MGVERSGEWEEGTKRFFTKARGGDSAAGSFVGIRHRDAGREDQGNCVVYVGQAERASSGYCFKRKHDADGV